MVTSKGRTRTRLSPERRKKQLLIFALDAFSKRGIGRAGHADIAEMAHVSVATVFNYFPTREDLVDAVLEQADAEFKFILEQCIDLENKSMRASLNCITSQLIDAALEDKEWLKVWFEWSTSIREDIWPRFVASNQTANKALSALFAHGIARGEFETRHNPDELAKMLGGICYVLYLQANQQPDKEALCQQAQTFIDILCNT